MSETRSIDSMPGKSPVVFLVSQPRAGSTLLQKLLAGHSEIATTSEPWIMLHASSVFRPGAIQADYDANWADVGLQSFLQGLPGGRQTYVEGLRRMYGYLYGQASQSTGGRIFLDKTPRYYLAIPELLEIFPQAKVILLMRNPLAVLVSIINTWTGIAPGSLYPCRHDLLTAPRLLKKALHAAKEKVVFVRYENLAENAEKELRNICRALQIDFQQDMLKIEADPGSKWTLGDQEKLYMERVVDSGNHNKWIDCLEDTAIWRLCSDYLEFLGEDIYSGLGYDWDATKLLLSERSPAWYRRLTTLSLGRAVGTGRDGMTKNLYSRIRGVRVFNSISRRVRHGE